MLAVRMTGLYVGVAVLTAAVVWGLFERAKRRQRGEPHVRLRDLFRR